MRALARRLAVEYEIEGLHEVCHMFLDGFVLFFLTLLAVEMCMFSVHKGLDDGLVPFGCKNIRDVLPFRSLDTNNGHTHAEEDGECPSPTYLHRPRIVNLLWGRRNILRTMVPRNDRKAALGFPQKGRRGRLWDSHHDGTDVERHACDVVGRGILGRKVN